MISPSRQAELRAKYNPDGSVLRRAQLRMLEMLKFIDEICLKNDIDYWIDCGTLLGAARHGGFIPWDDDMDICMTRESYKKFKKLMLSQNPSKEFVLQCDETDKGFYSTWDVLRDLKSEYIQDSPLHNMRKYRGVQVDIFYQDDQVWDFFRLKMITLYEKTVQRVIQSKKKIAKILRPFLPFNYLVVKKILPSILHFVYHKKNDYYRLPYGAPFDEIRYKKNVFPLGRIEFEGMMFNAPGNVDAYLSDVYGDWNKVPDDDQVQTHNVNVLFFDDV